MEMPEPQTKTFPALISDIESGKIKIPQFQRDFVWTKQKCGGLIDSIIKGYPIGTFIFWKTKERLRSIRNLGGHKLPDPAKEESVDYVLDGQQRLTSLYACLKGIEIKRSETKNTDNFAEIYIDLEANDSDQVVVTEVKDDSENRYISILELLKGDFETLASYPKRHHRKLKVYKNRIESYQYSVIQIRDTPIDIATEIFTRINVGGKPLSLFEIMTAKTFDQPKDFDLSEKFASLIDSLKPLDYETISDATTLQTVSMIVAGECKRQVILKLPKDTFIEAWGATVDAIQRAVEYFRSAYRIPVSQLLPYNALIVPFAYFFYKHPDKPTKDTKKRLEDFFWRCSLSGRYSSGVEGKLAQDIKRIDDILLGKLPSYDWPIDTSPQFIIDNGYFSAGRSYIKAILCIYAYRQPKSFNDNSLVNISNYWLKQANSKNYHHFFPKAFLVKKGVDNFYINHILNITIVDDFLNKREIGAKPPAKYMKDFAEVNHDLCEAMKSHYIDDLEEFGIWSNDYDTFFEARASAISAEIKRRIIVQQIDEKSQAPLVNDIEEDLLVSE